MEERAAWALLPKDRYPASRDTARTTGTTGTVASKVLVAALSQPAVTTAWRARERFDGLRNAAYAAKKTSFFDRYDALRRRDCAYLISAIDDVQLRRRKPFIGRGATAAALAPPAAPQSRGVGIAPRRRDAPRSAIRGRWHRGGHMSTSLCKIAHRRAERARIVTIGLCKWLVRRGCSRYASRRHRPSRLGRTARSPAAARSPDGTRLWS